jgi:cytochrome c
MIFDYKPTLRGKRHSSSCAGLTRASIFFERRWIAGSSPAMTTRIDARISHRPLRLLAALAVITMGYAIPSAAQDAGRGEAVFEQCAACHSLQAGENGAGPTLHGLFGRKSASEDFVYSAAMRRANVTWTPELLDSYLSNPQGGGFRGNRMPFAGIADAQTRKDLIAYLEQATK